MTDDTVGIPTAPEAVAERLRAETKRVQQADAWIGKLIGFGVTAMALGLLSVIVLASMLTRGPIAEHWRQTWNALGLALFIAGVATACSGLIISSARRRAQLARLEQAAQTMGQRAERELVAVIAERLPGIVEDAVRQALGGLVASEDDDEGSDGTDVLRLPSPNVRRALEKIANQIVSQPRVLER